MISAPYCPHYVSILSNQAKRSLLNDTQFGSYGNLQTFLIGLSRLNTSEYVLRQTLTLVKLSASNLRNGYCLNRYLLLPTLTNLLLASALYQWTVKLYDGYDLVIADIEWSMFDLGQES